MAARCSETSWAEASGVAAQAIAIAERAAPLARVDAQAWEEAAGALREAGGDRPDSRRDFELERKLERAAAVPLEIAQLAADAAELAVLVAERCEGGYRADVAAAASLAAGSARAAAHLVEVNLGVREDDPRLDQARASEQAAAAASAAILGSGS